MKTNELLKSMYYYIVAGFYLRLSSRLLTIVALLDNKAAIYVDKQKEILNKQN